MLQNLTQCLFKPQRLSLSYLEIPVLTSLKLIYEKNFVIHFFKERLSIIKFSNNNICFCQQVCALLWSKEYKELISSHGFAHYQLIIWKYPSMTKVAEMTGLFPP